MEVRCIFVESLGSGDARTTRIQTTSLDAAENLYLSLREADNGHYPPAYFSINGGPWCGGTCWNFADSIGQPYRGWRNWERNWSAGLKPHTVYHDEDLAVLIQRHG